MCTVFIYFIHRAIKLSSLYNLRAFSSPKPYLVEVTSSAFIPKYLKLLNCVSVNLSILYVSYK